MPNPGSDEAIDMGCTCAVLDNAHGRGYFGEPGVFVMSGDCPLHGSESRKNNDARSANSNKRSRRGNTKQT
jgi:hypothetical protein